MQFFLSSRFLKTAGGTEAARGVVDLRRAKICTMNDPKVKFLKLMPQSNGTKVQHTKKRQVPHGLVAVKAKKGVIFAVMMDFKAKGERQSTIETFVPAASMFFVEATRDVLMAAIPKHTQTACCTVM